MTARYSFFCDRGLYCVHMRSRDSATNLAAWDCLTMKSTRGVAPPTRNVNLIPILSRFARQDKGSSNAKQ